MKKVILIAATLAFFTFSANAQTDKMKSGKMHDSKMKAEAKMDKMGDKMHDSKMKADAKMDKMHDKMQKKH